MKAAISLALAAGLGALVASGPAPASKPEAITAKYHCKKGPSLKVVFRGGKAAVTPKGGQTVILDQGMSADGFYYARGKYSLRGRGNTATWTAGKAKPLACIAKS